jgi:hypothetical protein
LPQGAAGCLGSQQWSVAGEAAVQRVGIERESVVERIERQRSRAYAVVAQQYPLQSGARAPVEPRELTAPLQRFPALRLRIPIRRNRRAESKNKHRFASSHLSRQTPAGAELFS